MNNHLNDRELLLDTDDALVNNRVLHDVCKAWAADGQGRNELGKIWMKLREEANRVPTK